MKQAFFLIFIVLLCAIGGCRKKEFHAIGDQRLRDAVDIHPGSYFIYADSVTGLEDSFYVTSQSPNPEMDGWEAIEYIMQSSMGNTITIQAKALPGELKDALWADVILKGSHYRDFPILQLPLQPQTGLNGTPFTYHSSYSVLSKDYNEVYEGVMDWRVPLGDTSNAFSGSFHSFYSIKDGLVRFEAYDSANHAVYNLKRSYIVRD